MVVVCKGGLVRGCQVMVAALDWSDIREEREKQSRATREEGPSHQSITAKPP